MSETVVARSTLDIFRPIGRIAVSGRSTPLALYEPMPDMAADERRALVDIYRRFDAGDRHALDDMRDYARAHPDDRATANLIDRLQHIGPGGSFVLENK